MIAAVAKLRRAILVHKDPEFEALAQDMILLPLPYKIDPAKRISL
jgi:hypothetical protein